MKLENNKYLVLKSQDIYDALTEHDYSTATYHKIYDAYYTLVDVVNSYRAKKGKLPNEYLVINKDTPEYEPALNMLLGRLNKVEKDV